ncbi:MAG: FMN-binding protein [Gudongella sp.]|jgi:uncharacterized protein with FMN-binding domain|nr:FMN-binding protein [Gudongella sp.]
MKKVFAISLVLVLLAIALTGCGGDKAETSGLKDGTYEAAGEGMHALKVSVEVKDGKIAAVNVIEHEETDGISDPALAEIPAAIVEKNSTNVDIVSGATLTSNGIIEAVNAALEGAK